ncbi:serine/threonine-protein kinase [Streptomyces sp. NPDC001581]|uniref:serine/threonine-protein kinase n=1 Tax=Streptomyces sp. NPDC001581 TaxID=3154386 RepID=UPI00332CE0E2
MGEGELVEQRYRLLRPLGRGSVGVVHEAEDTKLQRHVALKLLTEAAGFAADSDERVRFHREAEALTRLRHPGVITLHESGEHKGTPYLVMQLLDGMNLAQLVGIAGPLTAAETSWIGLGMAEALDAVHAAGVLHRDLKPSNVGVTRAGDAVILDFGLAQLVGEAVVTAAGVRVGTPQYMAPEIMQGGSPSRSGDLYALGACLYFLATAQLPLGDRKDLGAVLHQALGAGIPHLRDRNPSYPAALTELVDSLCARDPADRPTSAAEVASRLGALADGGRQEVADHVEARVRDGAVRAVFEEPPAPAAAPAPPGVLQAAQDVPEYRWKEDDPAPALVPGTPIPVTLSRGFRLTVLSEVDEEKASSRLREAVNLVLRGRIEEASQMLSVLASACTASLGPTHSTTLTAEYWQGVCLARVGARHPAVEVFARVNQAVDQRKESNGA